MAYSFIVGKCSTNTVKVKSATNGKPMGLLFLETMYEPGDDLELKNALKTVAKTFFLD